MSFAFHEFQCWQQYSSRLMSRYFKSVSMRVRFSDWNTVNTHAILPLAFNYISNMKYESGCAAHHCTQISDLFFNINIWIIIRFVDCYSFYLPFFTISQKLKLALTFTLFVSAHMCSVCKSFCSIWVSSSSYIPRRIRVQLVQHDTVKSIMYFIIYIRYRMYWNRRDPNTDPCGMPLLTWASLDVVQTDPNAIEN